MDHPFEVGNIYKNRQGPYEVVYLNEQANKMIIRYLDTGEEVEISISIQARIWRNIGWDEQARAQEREAAEARYQQGYGKDFSGLIDSDFKTNTEGTTWRSRRGLAGSLAQYLSADTPYTFVSWAIYGWPVAFLTHREDYQMAAFEMGSRKAKFMIELDENRMYYGLYLEGSVGEMDATWDWTRLLPKLQKDRSLQELIIRAEAENKMRFLGRTSHGQKHFHFVDGPDKGTHYLWDEVNSPVLSIQERLNRLTSIPKGNWGEIYFLRSILKAEALQKGVRIAQEMAADLRVLLPLYAAAVQV